MTGKYALGQKFPEIGAGNLRWCCEQVGKAINKERYTAAWAAFPYALLVSQMVVPIGSEGSV
jgi:hypothetical protein